MHNVRILAGVLLAIALPAASVQAQQLMAPLPLDSSVTIGTLENGIRYYIRENARPEDRAELRLVVNTGSVLEDTTQLGLAHFVEHMAFNGTERFQKQAIVDYLERIGMRFGADVNAYTSFDETVYMLTVPTDTGAFMVDAFRILRDWATSVSFEPEEVEKERGVVVEEWRLGQGSGERLRAKIFPVLFQDSRYANRLPIGTRANLEGFAHEDLVRFYRDWYRPELMAVVAVGDFDKDRIEQLIRESFGSIPASPGLVERPAYHVPDGDAPRAVIATDPEATNTIINVYWLQPTRVSTTVGAYRAGLVEGLYNQMLNARLAELAQQPNPPFIGAASQRGGFVRTKDVYALAAAVQDGGTLRGLEALLTEAERVARHGFTTGELERARANLLRGYEQAYAERDKTNSASYAAEYTSHYLEGEPAPGISWEYTTARALLPGVTVEEVNRLARDWIADQNRVVVVEAPEAAQASLPNERQLLATFAAVEGRAIAAYEDDDAGTTLLATMPAPGRVVAIDSLPALNVTQWQLSNGVRVLVKPTDFKDDEVLFRGFSPGGSSLASDADLYNSLFATTTVEASGLGEMTAVQVQKALAGKAVSVDPFIADTHEGVSGAASPQDLETALQLVHLYFTGTRLDADAVSSYQQRLRAALANRNASPQAAFQDTLVATMSQQHPRVPIVDSAAVSQWQPGRALEFFQERFDDASDFTFVFVGNIDPAALRPLVEQYLGSLPSAQRSETWTDHGVRPPTGKVEKLVRRGLEPQSVTQIIFTGELEYTPENRHALRSLSDVLDIRLRDELREELGGTYGANVGAQYSKVPWESFAVTVQFGAAPERLNELVAATFREIESLQQEGPNAELLAKVQEVQRRELQEGLRQNGYWLANLAGRVETGEPPLDPELQRRLIDELTGEKIRNAARRYLDLARYVRVSLYPENAPAM